MRDDQRHADVQRRIANTAFIGTVEQLDAGAARVRVRAGELLTGWMPWTVRRASRDIEWWAPEIGEQVLVVCPGGDPAQGVVIGAFYQAAHPAPADRETVRVIDHDNWLRVEIDRESRKVTITLDGELEAAVTGEVTVQSESKITLRAPSVIISSLGGGNTQTTMTGSFRLQGDLEVEGSITTTGSVTDAGGNTNHHSH